MRVLMVKEVINLYILFALHLIARYKGLFILCQSCQHGIDINVVIRQQHDFQLFRVIFQPSVTICLRPEACKQQSVMS